MKEKAKALLKCKNKTVPILSFPAVQLLGISVRELLACADMQAEGMKTIVKNCNVGASLNMMDLSVEAEAFGAKLCFCDNDVPTVEHGIIEDITDAANISVPGIGAGRTSICLNGIRKAKEIITDIPVFCGVIGPYSLAGRLFDMTELMLECFDRPDEVRILLSKATEFIIRYIRAFREHGADGVILAEPAAGLLSPDLAEEFSMPFVRQILEETVCDDFIVCYHNCGNTVGDMLGMISDLPADIIHLGNATDLPKALKVLPKDKIVMGNINPVIFRTGTPDEIKSAVHRLFDECSGFDNFMISTGCDVPADARWENINAYFETIDKLYK